MSAAPSPVAIVTGASRGIGAAPARRAAAPGFPVVLNIPARRDAADAVVTDIVRGGGRAIAVGADVAQEADVVRLFETCDRELGTVTALVNNAGILETQMRVEAMDAQLRLGFRAAKHRWFNPWRPERGCWKSSSTPHD